ncbi:type IV pilin protein [Pseudomonas sp. R2.Fl]|nr:type IV pilin protein [Pseudomonas sp. R2.Fl]
MRSRRAAGAACLQERAQFMERYYTTNLSYAGAPNPPACDAEVSPFYQVSFVADPTATAFTLQAVPQGAQAERDTQCGTLTLDQQGSRGTSNEDTPASECW